MLAAAVLGLLLTTPSLEARTKHHAKKKMKIVFDGSEPAAPKGELGDEIVQPRSSDRAFAEPGTVVRLRGSSVDDIWKKNKMASRTHAKARAERPFEGRSESAAVVEENPDLMEPVATGTIEAPASQRSSSKTLLAANPSLDEASLGLFKKSKPSPAAPKVTKAVAKVETIRPLPTPIMEFEDVKPLPVAPARKLVMQSPRAVAPKSRIYLRNIQPVVSANSLAIRAYSNEPPDFKFNFAFENTTSMGRKYELETPGGRNYLMKNEIFVGTTHASGWGAKLSLDYVATSNDDSKKDVHEMADPSVIVEHPSLFKNRDVNIYGQARYFLPVAADSKAKSLQQLAYYLFTDMQLVEQLSLTNSFNLRYYIQASYADADSFSLVTNTTEVSRKFDWFGVGFGQRTQIESHQATSPGTSVEVYPLLSFLGISNTVIQAKLYIPLIVSGLVNGPPGSSSGPSSGGLSGAQVEFFARIAF